VEALSKCRAEDLLMVSDGGGAYGRECQEGGGGKKGGRGSWEALKREGNASRLREREKCSESLLGITLQ
jgi:hypothetical protein